MGSTIRSKETVNFMLIDSSQDYKPTVASLPSGGEERREMEHFYIYQKQATGKAAAITIADLIPAGRENAISRKSLVHLCVQNGLIEESLRFKDRAMRKLIEKDRMDFVILNRQGVHGGYYRPTHEDMLDLQRYIRQEEKRAKAIFRNIRMARALYEDFKYGRITT